MNTNPALPSLRNASSLLRIANDELCRPSEDTVTLCACQSTKNAVIEFLQSYLKEKNVKNITNNSLENLLAECCKIDRGFKCIDISCFGCKTQDENCTSEYCLDVKKVSECFERAKVVEEFVLAKLKVNPRDLA
ncbi:MAG: hypothetical protein HY841_08415 [Bacteroidetes bacterium]|nr:hypothetical protein [Bacteroidota bacterium]